MALLIGFALDQQVSVQKAFSGPKVLLERLGTLDAKRLAMVDQAELEAAAKGPPAIHRFPRAMGDRVRELAQHIADTYDGDQPALDRCRRWCRSATPHWTAAGLRRDEGQRPHSGAGQAARRQARRLEGGAPGLPDTRRRRLSAGACRLPGQEARLQGDAARVRWQIRAVGQAHGDEGQTSPKR